MVDIKAVLPSRTALLILDLQHGVLESCLGDEFEMADTSVLLERIKHVRQIAEAAGIEIVHVRFAVTSEQRAAIPSTNKSLTGLAAGSHFAQGTREVEIHAAAGVKSHERVFTKTRTGALRTTELDGFLKERHIDSLILVGVHTSGVILTTVRDAADLDYRLVVLEDCCADPDADVQEILMTRVFPLQADVIDTATFVELLNRSSGKFEAPDRRSKPSR